MWAVWKSADWKRLQTSRQEAWWRDRITGRLKTKGWRMATLKGGPRSPSPSAFRALSGQERAGFISEKNRMGFKKRSPHTENWKSSKETVSLQCTPPTQQATSQNRHWHTQNVSHCALKYKWPRISTLLKKATNRKETVTPAKNRGTWEPHNG